MHMVGAQHAAPLRSRRPTALLPYPFTRREVDSMTSRISILIGTAIVAGLTAAIRRPAPAPGAGGTPAPELTNTSWLNSDKRSEERRVGKECRSRWSAEHEKKTQKTENTNLNIYKNI